MFRFSYECNKESWHIKLKILLKLKKSLSSRYKPEQKIIAGGYWNKRWRRCVEYWDSFKLNENTKRIGCTTLGANLCTVNGKYLKMLFQHFHSVFFPKENVTTLLYMFLSNNYLKTNRRRSLLFEWGIFMLFARYTNSAFGFYCG